MKITKKVNRKRTKSRNKSRNKIRSRKLRGGSFFSGLFDTVSNPFKSSILGLLKFVLRTFKGRLIQEISPHINEKVADGILSKIKGNLEKNQKNYFYVSNKEKIDEIAGLIPKFSGSNINKTLGKTVDDGIRVIPGFLYDNMLKIKEMEEFAKILFAGTGFDYNKFKKEFINKQGTSIGEVGSKLKKGMELNGKGKNPIDLKSGLKALLNEVKAQVKSDDNGLSSELNSFVDTFVKNVENIDDKTMNEVVEEEKQRITLLEQKITNGDVVVETPEEAAAAAAEAAKLEAEAAEAAKLEAEAAAKLEAEAAAARGEGEAAAKLEAEAAAAGVEGEREGVEGESARGEAEAAAAVEEAGPPASGAGGEEAAVEEAVVNNAALNNAGAGGEEAAGVEGEREGAGGEEAASTVVEPEQQQAAVDGGGKSKKSKSKSKKSKKRKKGKSKKSKRLSRKTRRRRVKL